MEIIKRFFGVRGCNMCPFAKPEYFIFHGLRVMRCEHPDFDEIDYDKGDLESGMDVSDNADNETVHKDCPLRKERLEIGLYGEVDKL